MATVISYSGNRFVVQEMTKKEKAQLKKDKPEIYEKFFPVIHKPKSEKEVNE